MKRIAAAMIVIFPFVGVSCMAGAGGMGGGCGMGGMGGHDAGSHESHAQPMTMANAGRPVPDPNFDAARTLRVLDAYNRIVVALANDKITGVDEAAAQIVEDAPNDATKKAAGAFAVAGQNADIVETRERFKALSAAIVLYAAGNQRSVEAAFEKDKAPMPRKAYCPMVKTSWLQQGEKITNPFFGSSMLRCGEFQDLAEVY